MNTATLAGNLLMCALLAAGVAAQTTPTPGTDTSSGAKPSQLSLADQQFMAKTAEGGMAEVELGKLAAAKASSEDVKKFGRRMVDDHTKANGQLKQIATSKGVTVPDDLNAKDKAIQAQLEKLSGTKFDRAYMNGMVMDHIRDVAEFNREITTTKDPDVKNFASQTLPTLEDHLKNARSVASQTGPQPAAKTAEGSK